MPTSIRLPTIQQGQALVDNQLRPAQWFVRMINDALGSIEDSINGVVQALAAAAAAQSAAGAAQGDASGAQATADTALANAGTAQSTANAANTLAGTKVTKDAGATFGAVTGTINRAGYTVYTAPVISNPPTQAEVQAIANALAVLSANHGAAITDLRANHALTP
jgi:hypothetical protein